MLNEEDGATGHRKGGSEAEGKSQRRQPSKGLIKATQRLYFQACPRQRQTAAADLEPSHPLMYRSKERIVMEPTQGDTVTIGMMRQQAMEADPNYAHQGEETTP